MIEYADNVESELKESNKNSGRRREQNAIVAEPKTRKVMRIVGVLRVGAKL